MQRGVRRAGPADSDALAGLSGGPAGDGWPALVAAGETEEARSRRWRALLAEAQVVVLLAELGGRPAGYAVAGPARDAELPDSTAELWAFHLPAEASGVGLGPLLWEGLPDAAAGCAHRRLVLWAPARHARMGRFLEGVGFEPDGGRRPGAAGEEARFVVQLPDLPFVAGLGAALDLGRWALVARFLDPRCAMEQGDRRLEGGEAVVAAWRRSAEGGKAAFSAWSQERSAESLSAGRARLKVATRIEQGDQRHVHRVEEVVHLARGRCVDRVLLREPPGERQRLQAFLRRVR